MSADAALKAQGFAQYDLVRLREIFDYNEETGVLSRRSTGKNAGWKNGDGALRVAICKRKYLAHRVIWAWKTGAWPEAIIDHRDLDRTNNRWANLRAGGHSDNMGNTKARQTNKLGLKGVSRTRWGTYQVNITKHYKQKRVGSFDCPAAAHFAYIVAAHETFGEFARAA